jgi:hypothetical protein
LIEAVRADLQAEVAALRAELDELRVHEEVRLRRARAQRLLREYGLPDPDTAAAQPSALVSQVFFESLLAARDETAMRALVQERADLIAAARLHHLSPSDRARTVSREQRNCDVADAAPHDARSFARAIT